MNIRLEVLEDRSAPSSFIGSPWPQPSGQGTPVTLSYSLSNLLDGGLGGFLSPAQIHTAIAKAFALWAGVAPLQFTQINSDLADIVLSRGLMRGDPFLASANAPGPGTGGDVLFDTQESWALTTSADANLLYVATHEIGHALGLGHESRFPAIMAPVFARAFGGLGTGFLYPDDVSGIRTLYGAGTGSVITLPTPPETPTTAFAVNGVVSIYGHSNQLINRFVPFVGYIGHVSLNYDEDGTLSAVADNGHIKGFSQSGELVRSVLGSPPVSADPSSIYPGYHGVVESTIIGELHITLANQGGHIKAFDGTTLVASFLTYENYNGVVTLGASSDEALTTLAMNHVKGYELNTFNLVNSSLVRF